MFEFELFLGFPVDKLFDLSLSKVDQAKRTQFIQGSGDYLHEVIHDDLCYLGKNLGKIAELSELELIETNIYSLLKKLVPEFPYKEAPLYLFSVTKSKVQ